MLGWLWRSVLLAVNFPVLGSFCRGVGATLLFRQGLPGQSSELPRPLALPCVEFTAPLLLKSSAVLAWEWESRWHLWLQDRAPLFSSGL